MLKLKRLELKDFMCVKSASFDFSNDKVVLITGPNGSGKSTVLEAIALCLVENKRADTYKDYVMNGKESAHISLDAEIYDTPISFDVTLKIKNPPLDRTVTYKGKTYKNSEVTDLLGTFDIKYFSDIIMSMQGSDDITKLTPAQRELFLQKLLSFDFSEQVNTCKEKISELKEKITYNTNLIDFNKKTISERQNEIKPVTELEIDENYVNGLKSKVSELNEKLVKINDAIEKKNIIQNEYFELSNKLSNVNSGIEKLNTKESSISVTINMNKSNIDRCNEEISVYKGSLKVLDELKEDLEKAQNEYDTAKSTLTWDTTDYESILTSLGVERDNLITILAAKKSDVSQAEKHLSLIDKGVCPECGHKFDSKDKDVYLKALDDAKVALDESQNNLDELESKISENKDKKQKALKEKEEVQGKLSELENNILSLSSKVESMSVEDINNRIESLQKEIKQNEDNSLEVENSRKAITEERDSLNKELESIKELMDSKNNEKLELDSICNEYRPVSAELNKTQEELNSYNNQIMQNTLIIQNNEKIKESIKKLEKDSQDAVDNITKLENEKTINNNALQIFDKTFPQYLILKTCNVLEKEMNLFIHTIFPEMEIRLFQNKKGVEFFYTNNRSETKDFSKESLINVKMASGFEKALLSIAFKVSLCRAYGLRFAFFDEIDQSSTDENSENLFKTITSTGLFDQVFIITHKSTVRDAIKGVAPNLKSYYVHGKGEFSLEEDY